jgi:hypothetical protein
LEKGRRLLEKHGASLSLSNGWLDKFKKRNGIRSCVLHGEEGSVNKLELEEHRRILQEVLSQYSPKDVFNFDESALFYRLQPNKTLATSKLKGRKQPKDQITVAFCCNMDGSEKKDLVVIGRSANPLAALKTLLFISFLSNTIARRKHG